MSMVYKAVDHCCGHLVIRENASPLGKLDVRCQYQAFLLITVFCKPFYIFILQ